MDLLMNNPLITHLAAHRLQLVGRPGSCGCSPRFHSETRKASDELQLWKSTASWRATLNITCSTQKLVHVPMCQPHWGCRAEQTTAVHCEFSQSTRSDTLIILLHALFGRAGVSPLTGEG